MLLLVVVILPWFAPFVGIFGTSYIHFLLWGAGAYSIKERQTSIHDHFTHTDILESPISLTCITLDCGRNLENPERTQNKVGGSKVEKALLTVFRLLNFQLFTF